MQPLPQILVSNDRAVAVVSGLDGDLAVDAVSGVDDRAVVTVSGLDLVEAAFLVWTEILPLTQILVWMVVPLPQFERLLPVMIWRDCC